VSPVRLTIRSKDGVDISAQKTGAGPSLLLVHGALLNGTLAWGAVIPKFAERFTVYTMDRRGRVPSGDAKTHSIPIEADDIASVVAAIPQPVILLAHSFGALAAVDALDRLTAVSHAILYEPPLTAEGARPDSPAVLAKLDAFLAADNREEIVITFLRDQVRTPVNRLDALKASPAWPIILEIAPTLPRESRAVNTYRASPERLANCKIPTTIMLGSLSTGILRDGAYFLRDAIPGCRLVILEGQGHGAMTEAPDYFVAKVFEAAASVPSPANAAIL